MKWAKYSDQKISNIFLLNKKIPKKPIRVLSKRQKICGNRGFTPVNKRKNFIGFCPVNGNTVFGRSGGSFARFCQIRDGNGVFLTIKYWKKSQKSTELDEICGFRVLILIFRHFSPADIKAIYCIEVRLRCSELIQYEKTCRSGCTWPLTRSFFIELRRPEQKTRAFAAFWKYLWVKIGKALCACDLLFRTKRKRKSKFFVDSPCEVALKCMLNRFDGAV